MIERLNFYDIYGYLLPGFLLLFLFWLPAGIIERHGPPIELASAVVVLVLSYFVGHLMQGLIREVLPSDRPSEAGLRSTSTSAAILDKGVDTLVPEMKARLIRSIQMAFALDVQDPFTKPLEEQIGRAPTEADRRELKAQVSALWRPVDQRRGQAFLMCRRALLVEGAPSYAEQFQGLYALMRGTTAAAVLASLYYIGWILAPAIPSWLQPRLPFAVVVLIAVATGGYDRESWAAWCVAAAVWVAGLLAGGLRSVPDDARLVLSVLVVALIFVAFRGVKAYRFFASQFVMTVYRDFLVSQHSSPARIPRRKVAS